MLRGCVCVDCADTSGLDDRKPPSVLPTERIRLPNPHNPLDRLSQRPTRRARGAIRARSVHLGADGFRL